MRVGPAVAAGLAAACLTLPGLRLPFLSDDWGLLQAVREAIPCCTPQGDFRPLVLASLGADLRLFGPHSGPFHVVQALLSGLAAALVAAVALRYTGRALLSLAAGLLFAFHPYHVENAAWISARADTLMAIFFLLGLLAYERWRPAPRGIPWAVLAALEAALLSKESAIAFPIVVLVAGAVLPGRRPDRREWLRGLAPILALTAIHFALVRPWFLGGWGRTLLGQTPGGAWKVALAHGVAALLPLDPELLREHPRLFGALTVSLVATFVALARLGSGRFPWPAAAAAMLFAAILVPDVVGLQKRYLFLPSAAAATGLAFLLSDAGRRFAPAMILALGAIWIPATVDGWRSWSLAERASETLLGDFRTLAASPEVREIVVTDLPVRVRGASVGGDFRAALALEAAGRPIPDIHTLTWINTSEPDQVVLEPGHPPGTGPAEVWLHLPPRRHTRFLGPSPPANETILRSELGDLERVGEDRWRIRPEPAPGRLLVAWNEGRLQPLSRSTSKGSGESSSGEESRASRSAKEEGARPPHRRTVSVPPASGE